MDKVVAEIIIGAVILTLLVTVIPIYRSSASLVCEAGELIDVNENLREVNYTRLPIENDFISGNYLIDLVKYFKERYIFEILVNMEGKEHVINQENTLDNIKVKADMMFKVKSIDCNGANIKMDIELYSLGIVN